MKINIALGDIKMAKVIEQVLTVKISKIVKDNDSKSQVLTDEQLVSIIETLPTVCDDIIADPAVIVELD